MSLTASVPVRLGRGVVDALCCPRCHDRLHLTDTTASCLQATCATTYPVRAGVPILINDDNSVFAVEDFLAADATTYFPRRGRLERWVQRLAPDISRNLGSAENHGRFVAELRARAERPRVLVVGGGIVGSGMEPLLDDPGIELVETDVALAERTALVCDGHDLPFDDATFDGVLVQAVLEHVADPARCVEEIHRVLRPAGVVYAETPFMQQVHGGRYDFTRFTHLGHRRLFRRFAELDSGVVCGPGMAVAWSLTYFLLSFCRGRRTRQLAKVLGRLLFWPFPRFDRVLASRPAAVDAASGCYFLGVRSESMITDRELIGLYRGGAA